MSSLAQLVKEITSASPLTIGRNKMQTPDVCGVVLTLRDFDFMQYTDDGGRAVNYPIVIFDEMPEGYYCGGKALNDICIAIDANGLHNDLKANGLKIMLTVTQTRNNKPFVSVAVME